MTRSPDDQTGHPMSPGRPDDLPRPIGVLFGRAFTKGGVVVMLVICLIVGLLERFVASKPQSLPAGEALWPGLSRYIGLFILVVIAFAAFSQPHTTVRIRRQNSKSNTEVREAERHHKPGREDQP